MAQHIIRITKKDTVDVRLPKNGETSWFKVQYGSSSDQLWLDRSVAIRLRDGLSRLIAQTEGEATSS